MLWPYWECKEKTTVISQTLQPVPKDAMIDNTESVWGIKQHKVGLITPILDLPKVIDKHDQWSPWDETWLKWDQKLLPAKFPATSVCSFPQQMEAISANKHFSHESLSDPFKYAPCPKRLPTLKSNQPGFINICLCLSKVQGNLYLTVHSGRSDVLSEHPLRWNYIIHVDLHYLYNDVKMQIK